MSLWSHVDDDGDRLVLREFTDGNLGLAIHSRGGHVSLVYLKRAALLDLHDAIGNALLTKEDKQTLHECTQRNREKLVAPGADACLAFIKPCRKPTCEEPKPHGSHGASGCADLAEASDIPTQRVERSSHQGRSDTDER